MPSRHLAFLALCAIVPSSALARAWQGVNPGTTIQGDVVARFGEPSTQGKIGGRAALVYKGDQAITGTKQAQFFTREDGTVAEIVVFPATQLDKEAVEGAYGKTQQKTFTDAFQPVWIYRAAGVMVFFGKDGFVEALSFRPAETASPRAQPKAAAAAPERASPAERTAAEPRAPDRAASP